MTAMEEWRRLFLLTRVMLFAIHIRVGFGDQVLHGFSRLPLRHADGCIDFDDGVLECDSTDSSSTDSEDGYEDELESTYAAPTHGFLEDLELDDLRIPVVEPHVASRSKSTTIEWEKDRDA